MAEGEIKLSEADPNFAVTLMRKFRMRAFFWLFIALWTIFIIFVAVPASESLGWLSMVTALAIIVLVYLEYRRLKRLAHPICSFCGKPQTGDRKLVQGPGVFICPSCVAIAKMSIDRNSE